MYVGELNMWVGTCNWMWEMWASQRATGGVMAQHALTQDGDDDGTGGSGHCGCGKCGAKHEMWELWDTHSKPDTLNDLDLDTGTALNHCVHFLMLILATTILAALTDDYGEDLVRFWVVPG